MESGKFADLIVVAGDPLTDIKKISQVVLVAKEGLVYPSESLSLRLAMRRTEAAEPQ